MNDLDPIGQSELAGWSDPQVISQHPALGQIGQKGVYGKDVQDYVGKAADFYGQRLQTEMPDLSEDERSGRRKAFSDALGLKVNAWAIENTKPSLLGRVADTFGDVASWIPTVRGRTTEIQQGYLKGAYDRMDKGEAQPADFELIQKDMRDRQAASQRGFGGQALEAAHHILPAAAEFGLTGGIEQGATALAGKALPGFAAKGVGALAQGAAVAAGNTPGMDPKDLIHDTISNAAQSYIGTFAPKLPAGTLGKVAGSVVSAFKAMAAGEASEEFQKYATGTSQGGLIRRYMSGDPTAARDAAASGAVMLAMEAVLHGVVPRKAVEDGLKQAAEAQQAKTEPVGSAINAPGTTISPSEAPRATQEPVNTSTGQAEPSEAQKAGIVRYGEPGGPDSTIHPPPDPSTMPYEDLLNHISNHEALNGPIDTDAKRAGVKPEAIRREIPGYLQSNPDTLRADLEKQATQGSEAGGEGAPGVSEASGDSIKPPGPPEGPPAETPAPAGGEPPQRGGIVDAALKIISPHSRGEVAKEGGAEFRKYLSQDRRRQEVARAALGKAHWLGENYINGAPDDATRQQRFLEIQQARQHGGELPKEWQDYEDAFRPLQQEEEKMALDRGLLKPEDIIENYLGLILEKADGTPGNPAELAQLVNAKRPLSGSEAYRKGRINIDWEAAIKAGYRPKGNNWNPVDIDMAKLNEVSKSIRGHDIYEAWKNLGYRQFFKNGEELPPGWTVSEKDPKSQVITPDKMITGRWANREELTTLLDNYLSKGAAGNPLFEAINATKNASAQMVLGGSGFHFTFSTMTSFLNGLSAAFQKGTRGDFKGAFTEPFKHNPIADVAQAMPLMKEYYKPGSGDPEVIDKVKKLVDAGWTPALDPSEWGHMNTALKQSLVNVRNAMRRGEYGQIGKPQAGNIVPDAIKAPFQALGALAELTSAPTMKMYVPPLKAAAGMRSVQRALERLGPDASPNERLQATQKAYEAVEDRVGQMTYDNIGWHNGLKQLLQNTILSPTWNFGTARVALGGLKDIPASVKGILEGKGVTDRAAFLMAMTLGAGALGAIVNKLSTGEWPKEFKDFYWPRDGSFDKHGVANRWKIPGYHNDVMGMMQAAREGPMSAYERAAEMAKNKLWGPAGELAQGRFGKNEDYYGNPIYDPKAGGGQQVAQFLTHEILDHFTPIALSMQKEQARRGAGLGKQALSFAGIGPANRQITLTPEQLRIARARGDMARAIKEARAAR